MNLIIKKHVDYHPAGQAGTIFFSYPEGIHPLNWVGHNTESSLDQVMHDFVQKHVTTLSTATIVFIPLALSRDYISLTGLRLGMHIRLTAELGEGRKVPIVFMGEETYEQVGRLSPLGSFLFTQGVDLIKEDNNCILEAVEKWKGFKLSLDYLDEAFLERVAVQPPDFYDSKHTLSNELSLLYLDRLSGHNVLENKKELELVKSSLYVKWVLARQHRSLSQMQEGQANNLFTIEKAKGKRILLIDDEWKKGWYDLLKYFFQDAKEFECLEIERSDTMQELESKLNSKIQQKDWDLFLLDIRMLDQDHDATTDLSNFSGFKLLNLIKQNNRGNQVILFSASEKQFIYDYGRGLGISDRGVSTIKEGHYADFILPKPSIVSGEKNYRLNEDFASVIEIALDRTYLKEAWAIVSEISEDFKKIHDGEDNFQEVFEFDTFMVNQLKTMYFMLSVPRELLKEELNNTFLQVYLVIEKFIDLSFVTFAEPKKKFGVFSLTGGRVETWSSYQNQYRSIFRFEKDKYSFQVRNSQKTVVSVSDEEEINDVKHPTSLHKKIAVLKYRNNLDINKIVEFLEFNYLRSHLAAHNTGNIDETKRQITIKDLLGLLEMLRIVCLKIDCREI